MTVFFFGSLVTKNDLRIQYPNAGALIDNLPATLGSPEECFTERVLQARSPPTDRKVFIFEKRKISRSLYFQYEGAHQSQTRSKWYF